MKRALAVAAVVAAGLALSGARPGNEFALVQQLNGQPSRWVMPDGGRSGVYNASGSTGCMPLTGAYVFGTPYRLPDAGTSTSIPVSPNVLLFVPKVPGLLCVRPSTFAPSWDGGCNHSPSDENYGVPLAANVPQYITPDSAARSLCFVTDAGAMSEAVWTVQ